jgi:hypothetical protein
MSTNTYKNQIATSPARAEQIPQTSNVNRPRSTDKAAAAIASIVQLFSTTELHKTVATVYIKTAGKPCEKWSLGNLLLMLAAGTTDARTYAAWTREKRFVKAGTKAFYILEPVLVTKVRTDPKTGEPVLVEGKPVTRQVIVGFKASPRFRYEDTDGEPLQEYQPRQMPPLVNVAEKWGVSIKYTNTTKGEEGYFSPRTNTIGLCVEHPATFFHELGHKAHSKIEALKPGQDPEQEAIAELVSCTLSELYGYDVKGNSYDYIASYAKGHSPEQVGRLCLRVLDKAKKVLDLILRTDEEMQATEKVAIEVAA